MRTRRGPLGDRSGTARYGQVAEAILEERPLVKTETPDDLERVIRRRVILLTRGCLTNRSVRGRHPGEMACVRALRVSRVALHFPCSSNDRMRAEAGTDARSGGAVALWTPYL
jgi:hypothetical protein